MARPYRPLPPAGPPADAAEGAARICDLLRGLFARDDGQGPDWGLMRESVFRAGFMLADQMRDDSEGRRSLMRRVHEGSYNRLAGDEEDEFTESNSGPAEAVRAPSNTRVLKSPAPRAPKPRR